MSEREALTHVLAHFADRAKAEPIEIDAAHAGPTHDDLERLGDADPEPLTLAGRYRLLRRLGSGGMAAVYLAEQLDAGNRRVALKILDASAHDWCRTIDRFLWEARLCARIRHPNVVEAYDYGSTPTGVVFMVMELLEGRDLRAIIRADGPLSWRWTQHVMRQVCAGINALHRVGVVHRDLKSGNCFYVHRNSRIKILDLGIATFEDPRVKPPGADDRSIVGTPEYMAPEQIRGTPVDRRTDVYAAGVLIYELLTGHVPFRGRTSEEVFDKQLHLPPPPLARQRAALPVPAGIDEVLRTAMAKRARDRFPNMVELARALDQLGDSVRPVPRPSVGANGSAESASFEDAPTLRRADKPNRDSVRRGDARRAR